MCLQGPVLGGFSRNVYIHRIPAALPLIFALYLLMYVSIKRLTLVLAVAALCAAAPDAVAQQQSSRVLNSWMDPVKLADGTETTYRYEVSFDYTTGVTLRRAFDASGALVETMELAQQPGPTPEEIAEATAIIMEDAEFSSELARANATVEGGFILFADQHPACVAPARCLQFDLMPPDRIESLRFVVVDLSTRKIVERDLFPDL